MKRKTLTTAVLAGLTGMAGMVSVSNAVNVNPDGLGQVLLYPYYTARGGNDTLISIVNTSDNAKSVKIRFLESLNTQEVLDFNIYMSAFDVWVAAITIGDNGGGKIIIPDTTCTVPYLFRDTGGDDFGEQPFLPFAFAGDGGPQGIERTLSGHIEVIDMGTLVNDTKGSATAATHVNNPAFPDADPNPRVPANCQQLVAAWTENSADPYWLADPFVDHEAPVSGDLFGAGSIINVGDGTMFSYNAVAIDGFTDRILHSNPGDLEPSLEDANLRSFVFNNGVIEVDDWAEPIFAVNAVLMFNTLMNEYVTGGDTAARSEWVLTFPTKRQHVNPGPVPPFTSSFGANGACEQAFFKIWDREEDTPGVVTGPPVVSPRPPEAEEDEFELCWEANVIRFGDGSQVAASEILREPGNRLVNINNESLGFNSGWVRFSFNPLEEEADPVHFADSEGGSTDGIERGPRRYFGLPVIGFWVNTFTNGTLEGPGGEAVLANYGGSFQHRGSRRIEPVS